METTRTLLMDKTQMQQRINRIAYQVFEDNFNEQEIIVAGIARSGYVFAKKIADALKSVATFEVKLIEVLIDKRDQLSHDIVLPLDKEQMKNKVIILVDDVLNSGKTMMYAMRPFLNVDVKKIRTVVLVDRAHKRFPVAADYVGMSLSTTLQELVTVEFENNRESVFLS